MNQGETTTDRDELEGFLDIIADLLFCEWVKEFAPELSESLPYQGEVHGKEEARERGNAQ